MSESDDLLICTIHRNYEFKKHLKYEGYATIPGNDVPLFTLSKYDTPDLAMENAALSVLKYLDDNDLGSAGAVCLVLCAWCQRRMLGVRVPVWGVVRGLCGVCV